MNQHGYILVEVKRGGSDVGDALVYVDGTLRSDHLPAKLMLSVGEHEVEVRKAGAAIERPRRSVKVVPNDPATPQAVVFEAS
jgi:hypothetical protein